MILISPAWSSCVEHVASMETHVYADNWEWTAACPEQVRIAMQVSESFAKDMDIEIAKSSTQLKSWYWATTPAARWGRRCLLGH